MASSTTEPVPGADATALPACPVETTLMLIGNKWKVLIIRDLLDGPRRFGELKRSVTGVSQKVLTQQLRAMEADGLLTRTVYPEVPPHTEYALTPLGHSLRPVLESLQSWGVDYRRRRMTGERPVRRGDGEADPS